MAIFKQGFGKYLDTGQFSDLTLVQGDKEYKVHRIVLSFSSEFFARLLGGEWKDSTTDRLELKQPDPQKIFPEVLRFMYEGTVRLSHENAIPLLAMADHYLIASLKKLTTDFIMKNVHRDNAVEVLERAVPFGCDEVIDKCINTIARNFSNYKTDLDWGFLSFPVFLKLVQHPYLAVKDEWALYQIISRFLKQHSDVPPAQVHALLENVRFRWMSYEQLQAVQSNPIVPMPLVMEALMARLKQHESPTNADDDEESDNPRLKRRILAGLEFEYAYDFDDKGIIYYIATNGGREPYTNPHTAGRVKVTASSVERGDVDRLVHRDPQELWTKDVPASWFTIDLGRTRSVLPTHYSLRHGANWKADSLRTWDLQASFDGQNWTTIKRHANDKSLNNNYATHTWDLGPSQKAYRFFRILQTGRNSNNHNFLLLCGFELYGILFESDLKSP